MGFLPCALLVNRGQESVQPPMVEGRDTCPVLFDQQAVVADVFGREADLLGKAFPVGPRHVCFTLHQLIPPELFNFVRSTVHPSSGSQYLLKKPEINESNAADMLKDFIIAEVDVPEDSKPFHKWLYPVAPKVAQPVYCPITVPTQEVRVRMMPKLLEAWADQGVNVPRQEDKIDTFFQELGLPGKHMTLKGEIALVENGMVGVRVPTWPSQTGGFITHDRAEVKTFCGIICCSGISDNKSNFNAAVAAHSADFLAMYKRLVLPTLRREEIPEETNELLK